MCRSRPSARRSPSTPPSGTRLRCAPRSAATRNSCALPQRATPARGEQRRAHGACRGAGAGTRTRPVPRRSPRLVLVSGPRRPTSAESRLAGSLTRGESPGVAESEPEPGRRQVSFAIRGVGRIEQRLVCRLGRDDMTPEQHTAATQVVSFLELEVARDQALRATEARFAAELLEIVRAGARRAEEAKARLESFGVSSDGPLMVMVMRCAGEEPDDAGLADQFRGALAGRGISCVVAESGGATVVFAACGPVGQSPPSLARELASELADGYGNLRIGVGGIAAGVPELRRSLLEAWHACALAGLNAKVPRSPRTATSPRTSSSGTSTRTRSDRSSGPSCWAR
jgi:PucR family transcriptional regulator, purine catabolism regulatory protein